MSYQEKKTLVNIATGLLLLAAYCLYSLNRAQSGLGDPDDLKFWAGTILTFIGIGVGATIIIQIVFHVLLSVSVAVQKAVKGEKEEEIEKEISASMVEDEMDKLIELKSSRIGYILGGTGFIAALVSVLFGATASVLLNICFISFLAGSLCEGFLNLYYYRRGVRNG